MAFVPRRDQSDDLRAFRRALLRDERVRRKYKYAY
jgi:hypothetical protein